MKIIPASGAILKSNIQLERGNENVKGDNNEPLTGQRVAI